MRNYLAILSISLLFFSCASSEKLTAEQKKARIYYSHGTDMLMKQKYTDALKYLLTAFKLDPDNTEIANNLGMAYFFKKQTQTAINFMQLSLKLDPKNSDARNNLASIYFKQKKYDKALEQYELVQRDLIYPHQYRTLANIGLIYQAKGMNLAAIEHFKLSVKENPDYCPAYYNLGVMAYNRYDYQGAAKTFKNGIMGNCYNQPATHYQLAQTYIKLRKFKLAEEKLIEIQKKFSQSKFAVLATNKLTSISKLASKEKSQDSVAMLKEKLIKLQEESEKGEKKFSSPSF